MNENNNNYGIYKQDKKKIFLKLICLIILPFFMVYLELKNNYYSGKKSILGGVLALFIFIFFWHSVFSNNSLKDKNNQLEQNLNEKESQVIALTEKIQEKNIELSQTNKKLKESIAYGKLTDKEKAARAKKIKADQEKAKLAKLKESYPAWIKKQFSAWDGDCFLIKEKVIESLNNPGSYKYVDNKYWKQDDYKSIIVKITFTAENIYGGTIKNVAHGKIILDENAKNKYKAKLTDFEIIQ